MKLLKYLLLGLIVGGLMSAAAPQKAGAKTSSTASTKQSAKHSLVDINSASEAELKELPGIGDAYAAKIVQNRPYRGKNELLQKKVVPAATYEKIKDQIVARQAGTKK